MADGVDASDCDATLVCVSQGPLEKLQAYKRRALVSEGLLDTSGVERRLRHARLLFEIASACGIRSSYVDAPPAISV